jgi:hypothetical protein
MIALTLLAVGPSAQCGGIKPETDQAWRQTGLANSQWEGNVYDDTP